MKNEMKWMWNGLKVNGQLFSAWYSLGTLINDTEESITVYARNYKSFPRDLNLEIQNDSDSMTDYFESDRIRVRKNSPLWNDVFAAYQAAKIHSDKMAVKRAANREARRAAFNQKNAEAAAQFQAAKAVRS